jgi:hypothetical protein
MTPRKSFTTKAGIELPLLNLKGKEYLQVMHRIQWFRSENPEGSIRTTIVEKGGEGKDAYCLFRAEILIITEKGPLLLATAHKRETKGGFEDYIEKAESGAIGRALGMCGYGTQFSADELEEGDRLADSPAPVPPSKVDTTAAAKPAATRPSSFRKNVVAPEAKTSVGDDI